MFLKSIFAGINAVNKVSSVVEDTRAVKERKTTSHFGTKLIKKKTSKKLKKLFK